MQLHETFSTRKGFLLAAIGSAVGLGNIWKFPYTLGVNGGAAFVMVYLLSIFLIAMPVMMAEMLLGRHGRRSAPETLRTAAIEIGASPRWAWLGWLGVLALFLALSFFSVVAGWATAYIFKTLSGALSEMNSDDIAGAYNDLLHSPGIMIIWHAVFMGFTIFIVSRGIKAGIERAVTIMMPTLFVMLVGLVFYGMYAGEFMQAVNYLFTPDFSRLTPQVTLSAIGQAFFSVNVGVGAVLTYAAYLPDGVDLVKSSFIITIGDTLVALLAGLMIFPFVFAYGLDPAEGPGLIFITLSVAFANMPSGNVIGAAFFLLIFLAALTSSLSMLEVAVCRLEEVKPGSRAKMTYTFGSVVFFFGFLTVLSFNYLENVHPLGFIPMFAEMTFFSLAEFSVTNVLMPIGGIFYALFVGWWLRREMSMKALGLEDGLLFNCWHFLIRYLVPVLILVIFIFNLVF